MASQAEAIESIRNGAARYRECLDRLVDRAIGKAHHRDLETAAELSFALSQLAGGQRKVAS